MRRLSVHERLQQRQWLEKAVTKLQSGDIEAAEAGLQNVLRRWPGQGDALHFLGMLRHRQDRSLEALTLLRQATAALPAEAGPWNNLGNVHAALHQWPEAERAYREGLQRQPGFADALANLANACLRQQRPDEAAALFRQALALVPTQALWQHQLAACEPQALPARASDAYLQQVFDTAAGRFDQHLGSLQYQGPQRVAAAVQRCCGTPQAVLDVGDLGCGTGLCAADLRPYARQLLGCDLSAGMLERAQQRHCYDSLVQQELGNFLAARPAAFDLLICADTLIYIGELGPVMAAVARALRPAGRLIFTIESLVDVEPPAATSLPDRMPADRQPGPASRQVRLQAHGRFVHHEAHVRAACEAAGLLLGAAEPFTLRIEEGEAVPGWLGVAQRPGEAARR
jgi:predicted TPR repeat methyltransferase